MRDIVQTRTGRHVPVGCGFHVGELVNIGQLQWAFVLGETDEPGTIELLWVDCIGVIIVLQYTVDQVRSFIDRQIAEANSFEYEGEGEGVDSHGNRLLLRRINPK